MYLCATLLSILGAMYGNNGHGAVLLPGLFLLDALRSHHALPDDSGSIQ